MRFIISFILITVFVLPLISQNQEDALRYSMLNTVGTARYAGTGGAFGSLGADISVMASNPAGLARLRNSIFSLTPEFNISNTSTGFRGNNTYDDKGNFNFSNIGIVGTAKAGKDSPYLWKTVQFGFAYNKTAIFNNRYTVSGIRDTSLVYQFAGMAAGIAPGEIYGYDSFGAGLAYEVYLIDPVDTLGTYYTTQMKGGGYQFTNTTEEKGGIGELDMSLAANYNDKLYLGGTVGFPRLNYTRTRTHSELASDTSIAIKGFDYTEHLSTIGRGINLKLGMIILPVKQLRIGVSYHSKTNFYYLQDNWYNEMSTKFVDTNYYASSYDGKYTYTLKTPSKFNLSVAGVVKKRVVLSAEVDLLDYTNSRIKQHKYESYNYSFSQENQNISTMYTKAINVRSGIEVRITKPLIVRAGFGINGSPYAKGIVQNDRTMTSYSGGVGYHTNTFYIDAAYTLSQYSSDYYMYDPVLVENTPVKVSKGNILITTGFKF